MLRLSRAALVATAAVLPFELRATLPLGPLRLSSVELFLYATLAFWGAWRLTAGPTSRRQLFDPRRWSVPLLAAAGLGLALLVSAAWAPQFRGPAVKFALRSWGGIWLGFAAADLLRAPSALRHTLIALVAGAAVAALAVVAETRLAGVPRLLGPFHEQTFHALGQARGSGPFQFPNIAAMALEAALPVALALGVTAASPRARAVAIAAAALLLAAVVTTASRAGLVGAAIAVLVTAIWWLRTGATPRFVAASCALLLVAGAAANGALSGRLRFWNEGRWYCTRIVPAGGPGDRLPARLLPGASGHALLTVQNQGALAWSHRPPALVALAYHWIDGDSGRVVVADGLRTPLGADVPPGAAVTLRAVVQAPERPGRYVLWWDLVQEDVTWFSERGDGGRRESVVVGDPPPPLVAPSPIPAPGTETLSRAQLWRAALAAFRDRPLLGVGPDNFRRLYPRYLHRPGGDDRLHANSLYFETLADLGLAGLAAWTALILALVSAARRAVAAQPLAAGVAVALGAFLLHGTLDYFFEFTPTYTMFWLLAGALIAMDPRASETSP